MEKLSLQLHTPPTPTPTATLPKPQFLLHHSLFPGFTTRTPFPTEPPSQLCCRRSSSRHRRFEAFANKQGRVWVSKQTQAEAEEEEEEGEASYSDDDLSFLSLSEKPDRSMALLDDYEAEELDLDYGPNHRSGSSPFFVFRCGWERLRLTSLF